MFVIGGGNYVPEYEAHNDLKGLSRFDQPHSFLARGGYDLPYRDRGGWRGAVLGDWSVSGVVLLKTGTPFSVTAGSDSPGYGNVDGVNTDRPNLVDAGVLGRTIGNPDTYWATDDGVTTASMEVDLGKPTLFNRSMVAEHIALGQRIEEYSLEAWDGSAWQELGGSGSGSGTVK